MKLNYKILKDWIMDPRGNEKDINRAYPKHWREKEFRPDVEIGYEFKFLYEKGELERMVLQE